MIGWLQQHGYAIKAAWRHIRRPRGGFILNVLVIAVAMTLPLLGLAVLESIRPVSERLVVEPEVSIFLAVELARDKATSLQPQIKRIVEQHAGAARTEFVPREKALAALDGKTGIGAAVSVLGKNPLPDAYIVKLRNVENAAGAESLTAMAAQLTALPGVDHVQIDSAWIKRLAAIWRAARLVLLLVAAVLCMVVITVVFNTIRLQVLGHRDEIELSKLVGALNNYICRPFYYAGALLGVIAGAIGLCLAALALQPLNQALAEVTQLYAIDFQLSPLGIPESAAVLAFSASLGWLGAFLSVRRSISKII